MNARMVMLSMLVALQASAAGLVIDAGRVPGNRELTSQIAAARAAHPDVFATVAQVKAMADKLDATKRGGRVAPMGRTFKQLGPEALWPLLEVLAFDVGLEAPATEGGKLSLAVGLLEAVGALQDSRAAPVLEAIVSFESANPVVTRAAAEAYGFLQTDAVAERLIALGRGSSAHARAVREGMGSCRRVVIAKALVDALDAATDVREQVELSRALGDVGNSWAWQTPAVTARSEEREVKLTAVRGLLRSYLERTGDARQAAGNALLVVDSKDLPALIAAAVARGNAEQRAALQALQARLERNPVR